MTELSDEVLIGEGVILDARPAAFASRLLGSLVDVAVLGTVAFTTALVVARFLNGLDDAGGTALMLALVVGLFVGVPALVETLSRGRSLGKLAVGIRIVRDDGGPVRFRHALVRALTGVGELWLSGGSIALLASLAHPRGKRIGDILAGTYAVRVRGGERALAPLAMPPELAAWARTADIRRLPDGVALAARQFLGRTAALNAGSRTRLALELAAQVEQCVAPPPPLGTHPERFLAAVLAERRDREYALGLRRAEEARAVRARLDRSSA